MAKTPNRPQKPAASVPGKRIVKTTQAASESKIESKRPTPKSVRVEKHVDALPFTRMNYILLLSGIAVIILGFVLMSSKEFVDATQFSVPLHIAPVLVIGGFIEVVYAIMYRPKSARLAQTPAESA